METGTIKDLELKPGDVARCISNYGATGSLTVGRHYRCINNGLVVDDGGEEFPWTYAIFRIISRTSDTPKLWRDMSDEEKGALLLAQHEGKVIEFLFQGEWKPTASCGLWEGYVTYRVKPEPVRETVTLYIRTPLHRKIGTIVLEDGKPDRDSIKMEEA